MSNKPKAQSQSWQRSARTGDAFVIKGPKNEVVWGLVLDNNTKLLSDKIRFELMEDMRNYNIPQSEVRCVQLNSGDMKDAVYTMMHVSLIEMFIPNRIYNAAKSINWPLQPMSIVGLMFPMMPITSDIIEDCEITVH